MEHSLSTASRQQTAFSRPDHNSLLNDKSVGLKLAMTIVLCCASLGGKRKIEKLGSDPWLPKTSSVKKGKSNTDTSIGNA